ncbi:MAG TPA: nicotinamide riboside transporter PnuC [Bacteroidia bacterium]|nr:nicotinamide riboside transporter PnuC [Bacteroidia bacterium]
MSPVEIIGFVFGVAGIWLTIKENTWCFPVGLINVMISLVLFYQQKLYSDAVQQLVYIVLLSYGWYKWIAGKGYEKDLEISLSSKKLIFILLVICVIFSITAGSFFKRYDASLPYWDATATALSFTAQWMIAKKKIENWPLWIIVNIMYIGIYVYKDLYLYAFLFFIYLILAIKGWSDWHKVYKSNKLKFTHA